MMKACFAKHVAVPACIVEFIFMKSCDVGLEEMFGRSLHVVARRI